MPNQNNPVEGKVWGSTITAGAGATLSAFILWVLGITIWGASPSAENATQAVAAVPLPVSGVVGLLLTVGGAFLGGYITKHTPRLIGDVFGGDYAVEPEEVDVTPEPLLGTSEPTKNVEPGPKSYKA